MVSLASCQPWRGVRDDALSTLTGIPECVFVHATGFIGGNKTYAGVLAMAVASIELANNTIGSCTDTQSRKRKSVE
jgi:hypothetical protein